MTVHHLLYSFEFQHNNTLRIC